MQVRRRGGWGVRYEGAGAVALADDVYFDVCDAEQVMGTDLVDSSRQAE